MTSAVSDNYFNCVTEDNFIMDKLGRLLFSGGFVRTMSEGHEPQEVIVIDGGRVVGVGSASAMKELAGPEATTVELNGATVMPGLIDTHPHMLHHGTIEHSMVDLADARSHAEIVERIRAKAAVTPKGEWIIATPIGEAHYFIRRSWRDLEEGVLPDRHVLDQATTDHPVWIQAWAPQTPNITTFNTAGLVRIGIDRNTPDSVGLVWIDKDEDREPTGIIRGTVNNYYNNEPFWDAIIAKMPMPTAEDAFEGTVEAQEASHKLGVTTIYEGHVMSLRDISVYQGLEASGRLTMRVLCAPEAEFYVFPWDKGLNDAEFEEHLNICKSMMNRSGDRLRIDGITVARGGPCSPGYLVMRAPYKGPYGQLTNGLQFVPPERTARLMEFCAEQGVRLNVVVAGYRDHDECLRQLEEAFAGRDFRDRHWILQHVYFIEEQQAQRYAAMGFDVTTSLSFVWGKADMFVERIGEHVMPDLIPLRRLMDTGMTVACGSDWGPKNNIFEHMELAITRRSAGSGIQRLTEAGKVTRAEVVAMWTREAAKVLQWDEVGTLTPGNHADLIIVDQDPLTCGIEVLADTKVLTTIVGGQVVHDTGVMPARERTET